MVSQVMNLFVKRPSALAIYSDEVYPGTRANTDMTSKPVYTIRNMQHMTQYVYDSTARKMAGHALGTPVVLPEHKNVPTTNLAMTGGNPSVDADGDVDMDAGTANGDAGDEIEEGEYVEGTYDDEVEEGEYIEGAEDDDREAEESAQHDAQEVTGPSEETKKDEEEEASEVEPPSERTSGTRRKADVLEQENKDGVPEATTATAKTNVAVVVKEKEKNVVSEKATPETTQSPGNKKRRKVVVEVEKEPSPVPVVAEVVQEAEPELDVSKLKVIPSLPISFSLLLHVPLLPFCLDAITTTSPWSLRLTSILILGD